MITLHTTPNQRFASAALRAIRDMGIDLTCEMQIVGASSVQYVFTVTSESEAKRVVEFFKAFEAGWSANGGEK